MAANIFFLIIVIFMVCLVLMQVRNQNMKEKYAALWLSVGGVMIVLALFPKLLDWFSSLVGIETPVNLLFLIAIVMLMGISLHLTLAISKLTVDAHYRRRSGDYARPATPAGGCRRAREHPGLRNEHPQILQLTFPLTLTPGSHYDRRYSFPLLWRC